MVVRQSVPLMPSGTGAFLTRVESNERVMIVLKVLRAVTLSNPKSTRFSCGSMTLRLVRYLLGSEFIPTVRQMEHECAHSRLCVIVRVTSLR